MDLIKKELKAFQHGELSLNLLSIDDLPFTLEWRNQFREWFNTTEKVFQADHFAWFENYQTKNNDFVFIIKDKELNRVGQAAVYNINWEEKKGEFGRFLVNPLYAGKSYMSKTVDALLEFSRDELKLNSLYLQVKPNNERAIHIYKKAGFLLDNALTGGNLMMSYSF